MTDLDTIGTALYGPDWRKEMARRIGVNERNIRRMDSGEKPVPPGVMAELAVLLRTEARRLETMADELERDATQETA